MIDLSQYEIGQRFRTREGSIARLSGIKRKLLGRTVYKVDVRTIHLWSASLWDCAIPFGKDGISKDGKISLIKPSYVVPAKTRRIPTIKLDPVLEKAV